MNDLWLRLEDDRLTYAPGERLRGRAGWTLEDLPGQIEVRLYWKTVGKGTTDLRVVDVAPVERATVSGERSFDLRLPAAPYSFSGRLVSVVWTVELVVEPGDHSVAETIVVAPGGRAVVLPTVGAGGGAT
jgi:hypothetical protein